MKLANSGRAVVDVAKLKDYCLNPAHEDGKHKARVFAAVLGLVVDLPDRGLTKGQIGTVVEYLSRGGEDALLVEFSDEGGQPYAMTAINPDQIVVLHRRIEAA